MPLDRTQITDIFAKLAGPDPADFFHHVANTVCWDVLGTHPLAGHYSSKTEFQAATFQRLGKYFSGPLLLKTRHILIDGNWAAVELEAHATTRSGTPFHNQYCWICRFDADLIVEVRAYLDSALVARVIESAG